MDEIEALKAIEIIKPKMVIPMHYNCPMLFTKNGNPADDLLFKKESGKLGIECVILKKGQAVKMY